MARLHVRTGVDPDEPATPFVTLHVDPDGTPGERVAARLGDHCYEGDGVLYLVRTDGWAERAFDGHRLTVGLAVYASVLARTGVDPAEFPDRSAVDPEAVLILRAEAQADPELYARAAPATVLLAEEPGGAPDAGEAEEDWPVILAPPPGSGPESGE
ncbi:hypothetical protein ACF08W_30650 [Streptomyces sp. NPDC015144]|uniref:hypothetical protein n=1 Tax=Streptomyces sp. NPDC015144 TaxID=3364944 RepID=UPI003701085E